MHLVWLNIYNALNKQFIFHILVIQIDPNIRLLGYGIDRDNELPDFKYTTVNKKNYCTRPAGELAWTMIGHGLKYKIRHIVSTMQRINGC